MLELVLEILGESFLKEYNLIVITSYFPACDIIPNSSIAWPLRNKTRIFNTNDFQYKELKESNEYFYRHEDHDLRWLF